MFSREQNNISMTTKILGIGQSMKVIRNPRSMMFGRACSSLFLCNFILIIKIHDYVKQANNTQSIFSHKKIERKRKRNIMHFKKETCITIQLMQLYQTAWADKHSQPRLVWSDLRSPRPFNRPGHEARP